MDVARVGKSLVGRGDSSRGLVKLGKMHGGRGNAETEVAVRYHVPAITAR